MSLPEKKESSNAYYYEIRQRLSALEAAILQRLSAEEKQDSDKNLRQLARELRTEPRELRMSLYSLEEKKLITRHGESSEIHYELTVIGQRLTYEL